MNKNLQKKVLDSRQFIGLLLVIFSGGSLITALLAASHQMSMPPEVIAPQWSAGLGRLQTLGFLAANPESLIVPLMAATALLAAANFWLTIKKNLEAA